MFDKYIIKSTDTIDNIAKSFDTTPEILSKINDFYTNRFKEGLEINVPSNNQDYFTIYKINKGDNLYEIAKNYNINPILLAALNGLNNDDYIYPNQELLIPKSGYSYYITTDGDTLKLVADKFNTTAEDVITKNTIYLLPGQLIIHKN